MTEKILEFFAQLPGELYVLVVSMFPIIELRGAIPLGAGLGMPFYTNYLCSVVGNLIPVPFILLFISGILDIMARFRLTRPIVNWLRRKAKKHSTRVLTESREDAVEAICDVNTGDSSPLPEGESDTKDVACDTDTAEAALPCTEASQGVDVVCDTDTAEATLPCEGNEHEKVERRAMTPAIFWALMLFVAIPLPGTGAWTGSLVAALFNLPRRSSFLAVTLGVLMSGVIMCLASYGVVGFLNIFT